MTTSLLADAFAHHVWATLRILDACLELSDDQLQTAVPGTYGTILDTARHLVDADASYLWVLSDGQRSEIDAEQMDLPSLRATMVKHDRAWAARLATDLDPARVVVRHRDDGSDSFAPLSIRLAQVIHHGTDHRSQICTALTTLGIEPPPIDVWDFGAEDGRVYQTDPSD
jgi:uncharacterized damage-inducible protein DinB